MPSKIFVKELSDKTLTEEFQNDILINARGLEIQKISTNLYCGSHVGRQKLNAHQPIFPIHSASVRTQALILAKS